MNGHSIAQISTTFTPCTVGYIHYKKAIISHTQKINTVHVLEIFFFTVCRMYYVRCSFLTRGGSIVQVASHCLL